MSREVSRRQVNALAAGWVLSLMGGTASAVPAASGAPALAFVSATPEGQAQELAQWFKLQKLVSLPDDVVVSFFRNMSSRTYAAFLKLSAQIYREAEFWVRRQERLPIGWTEEPYVNYIKYRHSPRQVYIGWMEGGPDAGQEVIYDETVDKGQVYGHFGGAINVLPFWLPINSPLARLSSNHSIRDMGLAYMAETFGSDTELCLRSGGDCRPIKVEIMSDAGRRMIGVTWERNVGRPTYYGKKVRMCFDLRKVYVRRIEVWDEGDVLRERVLVDNALARRLSDTEFRPTNPEYKF